MADRFGFDPPPAWLDHLRLSSVRLNDGGSAALVSSDGLLITNQHVAGGQLQKVSAANRDFVRDGFYARNRAEEIKCPDLEANVLVSYEDVTARVEGAARSAESDADAAAARRAAVAVIEKESQQNTGLRSDVVTLYSGGDYDNFTYPRHDLDIAFLRVYEHGRPAHTADYLRWSKSGPSEGEFVLLSGHPGSTDRMLTLTQIKYQRHVGNPLQRKVWETRRDGLGGYAKRGPEDARQAGETIRSLDNALKRLIGPPRRLENPRTCGGREAEE